jgi:hypothetical protein
MQVVSVCPNFFPIKISFLCSYPCITCIWAFRVGFGFLSRWFLIGFRIWIWWMIWMIYFSSKSCNWDFGWFGSVLALWVHVSLGVHVASCCFREPMYIRIHTRGFIFVGACIYAWMYPHIYGCVWFSFDDSFWFGYDWIFTCRARVIMYHMSCLLSRFIYLCSYCSYLLHASYLSC